MNLPDSERVIYRRNPLIEVVCQLRFPPILRISHQEPVEFQDEIRTHYPLFEANKAKVPPEVLKIAQNLNLPLPGDTSYSFKSEDERWSLSITKDFIALTTSSYERYEQFKERLEIALEVFERIYKPSFYTRIGLRYRDLIIRSKLEVHNRQWSELIAKHVASELHDPELSAAIQTVVKDLTLQIESGKINFKHGLIAVKNSYDSKEEEAYLFDADFYTEEKIGRDRNVWNILNQFNRNAGKLFRWSITDILHHAMQPQPVTSKSV